MLTLNFKDIKLKLAHIEGKPSVFDPIRKKWLVLTPEEHVRQYMIAYLRDVLQYPSALMAVEKTIKVGSMSKRFDIVVYEREQHKPWMLIECKAPQVEIDEVTLFQLLNYQRTMQCRYWLLTNGHQNFCADGGDLSGDINTINWLDSLPGYGP